MDLSGDEMKWQTFETHPLNNKPVLVSDAKGRINIAWYNQDPQVWNRDDIMACWTVYDCSEDYYYSIHLLDDSEPTHWMPLPAPPNDKP